MNLYEEYRQRRKLYHSACEIIGDQRFFDSRIREKHGCREDIDRFIRPLAACEESIAELHAKHEDYILADKWFYEAVMLYEGIQGEDSTPQNYDYETALIRCYRKYFDLLELMGQHDRRVSYNVEKCVALVTRHRNCDFMINGIDPEEASTDDLLEYIRCHIQNAEAQRLSDKCHEKAEENYLMAIEGIELLHKRSTSGGIDSTSEKYREEHMEAFDGLAEIYRAEGKTDEEKAVFEQKKKIYG